MTKRDKSTRVELKEGYYYIEDKPYNGLRPDGSVYLITGVNKNELVYEYVVVVGRNTGTKDVLYYGSLGHAMLNYADDFNKKMLYNKKVNKELEELLK